MGLIENYKRKAEFLYRWIRLGQKGITVESLLLKRHYDRIALYGLNEILRALVYELDGSKVSVSYLIDKKGDKIELDYLAYSPDTLVEAPKVDAIIITLTDSDVVKEVKETLCKMVPYDIISIGELLYEL